MQPRNLKYLFIIVAIFAITVLVFLATRVYAQTDRDLLNFASSSPQNAQYAAAYFKIFLKEAWQLFDTNNPTLTPVTIGILDTGVQKTHPEFSTGVNFGNTPVNTLVDDDVEGHGTGVVGIIGANNLSFSQTLPASSSQMNGIVSGVRGLNYALEVRHLRAFSSGAGLIEAAGDLFKIISNISDMVAHESKVINISVGTGGVFGSVSAVVVEPFFRQAFLDNPNTLFVVAAGNDGASVDGLIVNSFPIIPVMPAGLGFFSNVLTVGGTTLDDQRSPFSNFGSNVGIAAPYEPIYVPTENNFTGTHIVFNPPTSTNINNGLYDSTANGTSFSAPLVTGVAAILKAIKPNLTPPQIKQILIETADPIQTDKPIGPRLNALAAVCHPLVGLHCEEPIQAVRPGFDANILPANDDGSTGPVPIGFTLNFFGVDYSNLFVNNNGNLTFHSPLSAYTPLNLIGLGQPIIAPFFADVDTRTGNVVTYGPGTVSGRPAFGSNWPDVGCFDLITSVVNDFQVVLIDRSDRALGDFDIEFNYDKIQWETGQASGGTTLCEGGIASRVGFSEGTGNPGTFFELPGSGIIGSFLDSNPITGLINKSVNSSRLGRYLFEIRGGRP